MKLNDLNHRTNRIANSNQTHLRTADSDETGGRRPLSRHQLPCAVRAKLPARGSQSPAPAIPSHLLDSSAVEGSSADASRPLISSTSARPPNAKREKEEYRAEYCHVRIISKFLAYVFE